jgi:hypothetical protein
MPERAREALRNLVFSLELDGIKPEVILGEEGNTLVRWGNHKCDVVATISPTETVMHFRFSGIEK